MKKIILIAGKARSGKDTCANFIADYYKEQGFKVVRDCFAKYIKSYLKDYYNWDGETKTEEVRSKLQWLGTDRIKEELNYTSFHGRRLAEDFKIFEDEFDYFIVSDTRFRDEIYTMMATFPDKIITIRIDNPNIIEQLTDDQKKHKSENDLENFEFDWTIRNDSTLEALQSISELIAQYNMLY